MNSFMKAGAVAAMLGVALVPAAALAQAYPERPVTIVISGQVGGTIDAMARQLLPYWERALGQSLAIDNRSGAAGVTGVRYFLEQPADGYTIMIGTEAHYTAAMEVDRNIDSGDIVLINMQQFDPAALTVLEASGYETLEQLVRHIQDNPDRVTWGSPPTGTPALVGHLVARNWDLDVRFIPQAGGVESDTALLGGHVDYKLGTATGDSTELPGARVLGIAAPERLSFLPDVPTLNEVAAELGFEEIPSLGSARLVFVRAELVDQHPERFEALVSSYQEAMQNPEYRALLESSGQDAYTSVFEPEEATALFRELADGALRYRAEFASAQ